MNNLPSSRNLPIEHLAACFNNVTNSYKFYWFLSILENIKTQQTSLIPVETLLAHMVANVWYPVNYFYLSFGKQDRLTRIVLSIQDDSELLATTNKLDVLNRVQYLLGVQSKISTELKTLARFVPYRFLRPFFASGLRGKPDWQVNNLIAEMATQTFDSSSHPCLYRLVDSPKFAIEIQPFWFEYLQAHLQILDGFCLWHLLNYLQKNNPNVPNISRKIFDPGQRDMRNARKFWTLVTNKIGPIRCIYSGQLIQQGVFSLDHFLPWRFVAHDQLWNLIPVPKQVNSAKSDRLPNIELYFERFARTHYNALQATATTKHAKLVEDYVLLFKKEDITEVSSLPFEQFKGVLRDTILPQVQIAKNMGFIANWSYSTS